MKRYTTIIPNLVALACCLLLAACTSDLPGDLSATGDPDTRPLAITVSDGGMYSTPDPDRQTRAEEQGYQTVFTEGDRIGLYVVKNGAIEIQNLCLTLRGGKWTMPDGTAPLYYVPGRDYYAYYPYKEDMYMSNKVSASSSGNGFFSPLVTAWEPDPDQSTYAKYTASDLMTAQGNCNSDTDGNYTLHFSLEHRMALVVFQFPTTQYHYIERIDNIDIPKSYYRYTMVSTPFMHENPSTGRFLINPQEIAKTINFSYYSDRLIQAGQIISDELKLQPGRYTICQVDGGAVTEDVRPLKEGDFYMKDGGILPAADVANAMSADDKVNCLGVVFWVGENKKHHWTQTGDSKKGDRLLMRDHPECTHGIVVALHDASTGAAWAIGSGTSEQLYGWARDFNGFTPEEKADWLAINASYNLMYGYCSSQLMKLYRTHHLEATFPAYNTISDYATRHPAPESSSGWFFPAQGDLVMLCYGMLTDYDGSSPATQRDLLNGLLTKAGGDELRGTYWSTVEFTTTAWYLNFDGKPTYAYDEKSVSNKVRAVLAF